MTLLAHSLLRRKTISHPNQTHSGFHHNLPSKLGKITTIRQGLATYILWNRTWFSLDVHTFVHTRHCCVLSMLPPLTFVNECIHFTCSDNFERLMIPSQKHKQNCVAGSLVHVYILWSEKERNIVGNLERSYIESQALRVFAYPQASSSLFFCMMGTRKCSCPPKSLNAAQWASTILL